MWWHSPVISDLWELLLKDYELWATLGYTVYFSQRKEGMESERREGGQKQGSFLKSLSNFIW